MMLQILVNSTRSRNNIDKKHWTMLIKTHRTKLTNHGTRLAKHGTRLTKHGTRMTKHGAWFTKHGTRLEQCNLTA